MKIPCSCHTGERHRHELQKYFEISFLFHSKIKMLLIVQIPKSKDFYFEWTKLTIENWQYLIYIIWNAKVNYPILQNIVEQKWSMRVSHLGIIKSYLGKNLFCNFRKVACAVIGISSQHCGSSTDNRIKNWHFVSMRIS